MSSPKKHEDIMKTHSILLNVLFIVLLFSTNDLIAQRARECGIFIGVMPTGKWNTITDVTGVKVGHVSILQGDSVRTGVTAILPHDGNIFQEKVPAAIYIGNGFGKLAGISQVQELGNIETPIILTNTLSVPTAMNAVIGHALSQKGNETLRSVNAVVGETNDGRLNDIRGRHVRESHVLEAIKNAENGPIKEGSVGAGTGTVCFGFKGGIGTASRKLPPSLGGYTVGVLVQSNFGGVLHIDGVPVGEELDSYYFHKQLENADGSIMMVVATDAPLDARNLERVAKRAMLGMAKTGGIASNGSGDYVIAFSTARELRIPYQTDNSLLSGAVLHNDVMSPIFMATIEATEEAIINSLFMAKYSGGKVKELPIDKILDIMRKYNRIQD